MRKEKVSTFDVARWFIQNNKDLQIACLDGNIKLQKLLYYAQAMFLAVNDETLFDNKIEAWAYGPVIPEIYNAYRRSFCSLCLEENKNNFDKDIINVLKVVNSVYGFNTAKELIAITREEAPWKELKQLVEVRANPEIEVDRLKEYYKSLKDIYESYLSQNYDFENETSERINGNVFVYNSKETNLTDEDMNTLFEMSEDYRDKTFYVYRENGQLIAY